MHEHAIQKTILHRAHLNGFFSPAHNLAWSYVS